MARRAMSPPRTESDEENMGAPMEDGEPDLRVHMRPQGPPKAGATSSFEVLELPEDAPSKGGTGKGPGKAGGIASARLLLCLMERVEDGEAAT